jgi:hypothetical protein
MVFKATFKFDNISIILWQSVLLVEYPEKTTDLQYRKSLTNFISQRSSYMGRGIEENGLVMIAISGIQAHNISGDRH